MGNKLLLGAQAALLATVVGLTLPGCITVGDDDDNGESGSGGESGESTKGGSGGSSAGSAGKGGSGGTGGTAPAGGGSSGTGGSCVATGDTCLQNGDCCSFNASNGYCVGGVCADGCDDNSDCATKCCAELDSGGFACGPAEICGGATCADYGDTCSVNSDCCSYATGEGYCISDLSTCAASCMSNDECNSGCCVTLAGLDDGACAPAEYCE